MSELVSALMLNGFSYSGDPFFSTLIANLLRKCLYLRNHGPTISMGLGLKGMTSERDASIFCMGTCDSAVAKPTCVREALSFSRFLLVTAAIHPLTT